MNLGFHDYVLHKMRQQDRLDPIRSQEKTLFQLLHKARDTRFGQEHDFQGLRSVEEYQRRVPLRTYEDFWRDYWEPKFPRIQGETWPQQPPFFALSSGTTSGTTKYLPVTNEMRRSNLHAALTMMGSVQFHQAEAQFLQGQLFFLGGSTELQTLDHDIFAGDLSGIAAKTSPPWIRPFQFPPLESAFLSNWEEKVERFARESSQLPIMAVSGVPSWLLILFAKLKEVTGQESVAEIWPQLQLVIHGGTKFEPYENLFRKELQGSKAVLQEVYPCSEGFIAYEDIRYAKLRLMLRHGIFFEFVPPEELEAARPTRHTIETLETGQQYAVVVTTCAGLWSYVIGDTIVFEKKSPPLLRFTGRTKYFLSAFGEHLISEEVERAVAGAAQAQDVDLIDFHVGPLFPQSTQDLGRHRYLLEFHTPPGSLRQFQQNLDESLCTLNEDYAAHRVDDTGMAAPTLLLLKSGAFAAWMKSEGKLGGQHKVPRMDNSGHLTDRIEGWMRQEAWVHKVLE